MVLGGLAWCRHNRCVTAAAAEYALADLAIRLGAAQVPSLSDAEQDLAAAAAAMDPEGGANCSGRALRDDCSFWDFWDTGAGRDYGVGEDGTVRLRVRSRAGVDGVAGPRARSRDGGDGMAGLVAGLAGLRARIRAGEDPLGQAFCYIRPPEQRRGAGQTFTPSALVDSMISWAGRALTPARVVDPGAGSARFLLAAGRRWPEAELIGLETDPLAALIGRATLAAAGMAGRAAIEVADYRSVRLPAAPGRTLFLGNPPYVRHHQVAARWKDWFRDAAARLGCPPAAWPACTRTSSWPPPCTRPPATPEH